MIGAIIGDIVGSRFEFNNHRSTDFELFHPNCTFTDDTICTVAVADWLLTPDSNLSDTMRYWCRRYPSSYGGMFGRWIRDKRMGPYNSFGNGSAMRVSPVGWLNENLSYVLLDAKNSAKITHDHPEGLKGANCIADLIFKLRFGDYIIYHKAFIKDYVERTYQYHLDFTCDQIRQTNRFDETCQITVPQAVVCFLESKDFESAIRLAISIGGDSDTIAAITGSLAEAYYGIPDWMEETSLSYLPEDMKKVVSKFKKRKNEIQVL